jgi:hypothetical protein
MLAHVGPMLRHVGLMLGPCWAYVEASWAMLGLCWGYVGPMLGHLGPCWAYVGPMLGHVDLGHSINVEKHWILVLEQNKHTPKLKLNNA